MEQITVPQFLDVEDKIIGPITVRQFLEMLIAGMVTINFLQLASFGMTTIMGIIIIGVILLWEMKK